MDVSLEAKERIENRFYSFKDINQSSKNTLVSYIHIETTQSIFWRLQPAVCSYQLKSHPLRKREYCTHFDSQTSGMILLQKTNLRKYYSPELLLRFDPYLRLKTRNVPSPDDRLQRKKTQVSPS